MMHLGIDTSNYKTSLAAVDQSAEITANISEYLEVPEGARGLRQSDAFFKHSNSLPLLLKKLKDRIDLRDVSSVGVSTRPRRVKDSYMPCFLAGLNFARVLSEAYDIPLYEFSHQEGHAAAIMEKDVAATGEPVIFMHLSGGTTEFLYCRADAYGYETDIAGGTRDISFGQLLDRFGVALGLPFPAGMYIDNIASSYAGDVLPGVVPSIKADETYFNLSGPETRLMSYASNYREKSLIPQNKADIDMLKSELAAVSYEIMERISDILLRSSKLLCSEYKTNKVYMAGGVASSSVIRNIISSKHNNPDYEIIFGDPVLSGDNAAGIALLSRRISRLK